MHKVVLHSQLSDQVRFPSSCERSITVRRGYRSRCSQVGASQYVFPCSAVLPSRGCRELRPPPNKRLKLTGDDRVKGSGVLCPLMGHGLFVPQPCAGWRVARSLSAVR